MELSPEGNIPDAKTIWLFREKLSQHGFIAELLLDLDYLQGEQGYKSQKGKVVDASFVNAPKQRNNRKENEQIKNGETPKGFVENSNIKRQKGFDARWTKKNNQTFYGYKNHIAVDNKHKLIRNYKVTSAEVHDSQVFYELLAENSSCDVWADSAYRSEDHEIMLEATGFRSHVYKKGYKENRLSEQDKRSNTRESKVRARVEHVFGSIEKEQGGLFTRVIDLARSKVKVDMINLVYNMRRLFTLHRISVLAV